MPLRTFWREVQRDLLHKNSSCRKVFWELPDVWSNVSMLSFDDLLPCEYFNPYKIEEMRLFLQCSEIHQCTCKTMLSHAVRLYPDSFARLQHVYNSAETVTVTIENIWKQAICITKSVQDRNVLLKQTILKNHQKDIQINSCMVGCSCSPYWSS